MSCHSFRVPHWMLGLLLILGAAPAMAATQPTLFTLASGTPKVLAQGAQKSWPIKISEDKAFDAVFQGGMWLPNPAGGRIYAKYQRHVLHDNGTWTWIGTVDTVHGPQSVVLTFGKGGMFGLVPQASGYPLRIVTQAGQTRLVETTAAMLHSPQQLRLHSKPDYFIPPRNPRKAGVSMLSPQAPASAPVRAAAAGPVTIDVMVAYTPGFVTELGSQTLAITRIQNLVDLANQAYVTSNVNQQIRLVKTVEVNYPDNTSNDTTLDDLTGIDANGNTVPIPPALQGIAALRVQYGADLVTLIRSYDNATQGSCGVGWLIGGGQTQIIPSQSNAYGYNVVSDGSNGGYYCLDTTFAHELGHNMGNDHDRAHASTTGGAYTYSYGYLGNGTNGFSTIMAYGTATDTPLATFSNPNISSCQNTPCGVADTASNSADNAHSMNNTAALIAQFEPTMVGQVHPGFTASNDINGDGDSDLLWMNTGANTFGYWLMNGASVQSLSSIPVAAGYRVVATGDFNGDGLTDLVWAGQANDLYLWISNGRSFTSQYIGTFPSGNTLVGAADVTGSGIPALLFVNSQAHTFSYWTMNGATVASQTTMPIAAGYSIAAIGDFNGDGIADLVWTSAANDLYIWFGTGTGFSSSYVGTYPAGWQLVGAGDVNGDGMSDLIWTNPGTGGFGYWLMNGAKVTKVWSTTVSMAYHVAATGDFNGDGMVDVMWTSSANDLYLWTSNGSTFSAQYAGTYPSGWSIIPSQLMAAWGEP